MNYTLPLLFILVLIVGFIKKVNIYESFTIGARESLKLVFSIFPYITSMLILVELFTISGLNEKLATFLEPVFRVLGIPKELTTLIIIRPLSGNGSIALLENIIKTYGADSYIARCASIIVGASETIFYVATVYFSTTKVQKLRYAIPVSLFSSFVGVMLSCLLARIM